MLEAAERLYCRKVAVQYGMVTGHSATGKQLSLRKLVCSRGGKDPLQPQAGNPFLYRRIYQIIVPAYEGCSNHRSGGVDL